MIERLQQVFPDENERAEVHVKCMHLTNNEMLRLLDASDAKM